MSFQTRLAIAYGTAMAILCAMVFVSVRNWNSVAETRQWGRHSSLVAHRIESFHGSLERAEQIVFDSAGTSDDAARDAFAQSRSLAEQAEKDIRSLTADNDSQQQRLNDFEPKLHRYFELLDALLNASPAAPDLSQPQANAVERQQLAASLATTLAAMSAEEDRLAAVRRSGNRFRIEAILVLPHVRLRQRDSAFRGVFFDFAHGNAQALRRPTRAPENTRRRSK